jgi:ketosteroid isomerase-like protein
MADGEASVQARNKALVQDRFDAWAQGSGSPFELLAGDAVWTIEGNSVPAKNLRGPRDVHARGDQAFQRAHERGSQTDRP